MASAGRCSELHALVFDPQFIYNSNLMEMVLHYNPRVHVENQRPNEVSDLWYIPAVLTGKPDFGAPNCPSEGAQVLLRKGRRHLFISFKDNNVGKELSAASISRWICTTIVDSHASLQSSMNIPGNVKAQEVRVVATPLQQFMKVDLQAVMKAWRWSSGGTVTSFYLRDLCLQADSIRKTGSVLATGKIVEISS